MNFPAHELNSCIEFPVIGITLHLIYNFDIQFCVEDLLKIMLHTWKKLKPTIYEFFWYICTFLVTNQTNF